MAPQQQTIKAIETVYNGYRFRSRLEARWAVFFDTLGIKYEYEKEGFDLGEAGWYLPDFWLPELECWVEVKGQEPTEDEENKARSLTRQTVKTSAEFRTLEYFPVVICMQIAKPLRRFSVDLANIDEPYMESACWGRCFFCNRVMPVSVLDANYICNCTSRANRLWPKESQLWKCLTKFAEDDAMGNFQPDSAIQAAYDAARQARFEHGETPRPPR